MSKFIAQNRQLHILFQNLINNLINLLFPFVRMNLEIWIASEHGGEMCFRLVVEDVAGDSEAFGVGELVSDTKRRTGAFANEEVALTKPSGILVINLRITSETLLFEA